MHMYIYVYTQLSYISRQEKKLRIIKENASVVVIRYFLVWGSIDRDGEHVQGASVGSALLRTVNIFQTPNLLHQTDVLASVAPSGS